MGWETPVLAAVRRDEAAAAGKVGTVGYCCGSHVSAACTTGRVGYYGGQITKFSGDPTAKPKVPTILHFGEHDGIPLMTSIRSKLKIPTCRYTCTTPPWL